MTSIHWVCISDLHLGALNSLLTNVTSDGERCDGTCSSPVLTALCECLRSLRTPGQDPPELVVLGDLFELALTAPEDAAGAFSQFIEGLRPGKPDGAVAPGLRFVPGNHDHHLWSRASDDRYLRVLSSDATSIPAPRDRHATHLLPSNDTEPVRDRFVEILATRGGAADGVGVNQSYPNLGLVSAGRQGGGPHPRPLHRAALPDHVGARHGLRHPPERDHRGRQLEADNGAGSTSSGRRWVTAATSCG